MKKNNKFYFLITSINVTVFLLIFFCYAVLTKKGYIDFPDKLYKIKILQPVIELFLLDNNTKKFLNIMSNNNLDIYHLVFYILDPLKFHPFLKMKLIFQIIFLKF